ncbi:MAG TPA: hypothetical protein VIP48_08840, partial [Streptosporangiaceae bacterium]
RAPAQPAPDGAVPERAAAPWAGEPGGARRRPAEPGAAAQPASARSGPRLRYQTAVEMQPDPGRSPGTGPLGTSPGTGPLGTSPGTGPLGTSPGTGPLDRSPGSGPLGSIRTYQPGTGPQVALDDPSGYWAGSGPQSAVDTDARLAPADRRTAGRSGTDWPTADRPAAAPDTDGRGRKRRSASAGAAHPSVDWDTDQTGTDLGQPAERSARPAGPGRAGRRPGRAGRRPGQRRPRRMILVAGGLAAVIAAAGIADVLGVFGGHGPAHVLVAPDRLGAYIRRPQLEKQGNLAALQRQVIAKSAGQASHVVSAVYEDSAGSSPQMILFVGGNLSGVSASDFISSFTQQSKGAFVTSPGTLGGSAACVNAQASVPGSVALCTWADNDTFGVVASLTMNATKLAAEMRVMRPMVERVAK